MRWLLAFLRYPLGDELKLRSAARTLSRARIKRERKLIRETAQAMRLAGGLPPSRALEG